MPIVGPFTNALVLVNGVDLSDHCRGIHTTDDKTAVDVTAMGAGYTQETKGLGEASITLDFLSDFSAGKTHATLQPLVGSTTPVAVEVRALNQARSATNPAVLLASALLFSYSALDGS